IVGDCCSGIVMTTVDLGYISYDTTGAYSPGLLVAAPPTQDPTVAVAGNADGSITVTFEGTLQSASSINGPWGNVDGVSPLVIQVGDMKGSEFFRTEKQ
ncbi:MAG TPA: hypothetical protein QGG93_10600, partial [Verrucomicrobiota bacterium]|nr:hypothetical protein [Verrucomicrobiota bacterium]